MINKQESKFLYIQLGTVYVMPPWSPNDCIQVIVDVSRPLILRAWLIL